MKDQARKYLSFTDMPCHLSHSPSLMLLDFSIDLQGHLSKVINMNIRRLIENTVLLIFLLRVLRGNPGLLDSLGCNIHTIDQTLKSFLLLAGDGF